VTGLRRDRLNLATERLALRPVELSDAQAMFDTYASDPEAAKYMAFSVASDVAETVAFVERKVAELATGQSILWAIRFRNDEGLIGAIEVRLHGRDGDVGFIVGRPFWGRGIVPEALSAVTAFARDELALARLTGRCDLENLRSARVFEKCGFASLGVEHGSVLHPNVSGCCRDALAFALAL